MAATRSFHKLGMDPRVGRLVLSFTARHAALPVPSPRCEKGKRQCPFLSFWGKSHRARWAVPEVLGRQVEQSGASGRICHLPRQEFLLRVLENVQWLRWCQQVPVARGSRCIVCSGRTCFVLETLFAFFFLPFFFGICHSHCDYDAKFPRS